MTPSSHPVFRFFFGCRGSVPVWMMAAIAAATLYLVGCDTGPDRYTYVETLGEDTMAVESFVRTDTLVEGDIVTRSPATLHGHYTAVLNSDGTIASLEAEWRTPPENPDGADPRHFRVAVEGDSAVVEQLAGEDAGTTTTIEVPEGTIPTVGRTPYTYFVYDQALRQAMSGGGDSATVHFLRPGTDQPTAATLRRRSADTVSIPFFGRSMLGMLAPDGGLGAFSGRETTLQVETRPAEGTLDVAALAGEYASRDAAGEGLGVASPRATAEGTVAGANIQVDYSQPAMRGREIWGGLVPYGEVWRTGANAATHITTDRDLMIGDLELPAGSYTLWSMYGPDGAELIINEQTGQWGTQHDPEQDLGRVEMSREALDEPVERFTIAIEGDESSGELRLTWDTTRFTVPLRPAM